ncbi:tyrosine-type recombinase/integrase [Deinococcus radiopugnans]|uniref:tyrosine-type recombinase/integrase n=1 Tax=Deinococcus radiopugnans TaxID=57497 RepID=UPI00068A71AA|nr:tyrosine-type recombinase/integrase [Deinococcus radiopugnans]
MKHSSPPPSRTKRGKPAKKRANNEGSIYARKDKAGRIISYRGSITVGWKDGKQVRQSFTAPTKEGVRELMNRALVQRQDGILPAVSTLTVSSYLDTWLQHKSTEVRPSTLQSYRGVIENHLKPILGKERLDKLQPRHIDHLHKQIQAKGLSHRMLEHAHVLIHGALEYAVRLELLPRNVADAVKVPRRTTPRAEMKVWTTEQVGLFLEQARSHRLYALFYVALATGMRRGELMALHWDNTNLQQGVIRVRTNLVELKDGSHITEPKTRASKRLIPLASDAVQVLRGHRERQKAERAEMGEQWQEHDLVFPTQLGTVLDSANLTRTFHTLATAAEVPRIRLHDLRHTHASLLAFRGVAPKVIADRLGHTNVGFTMQVYTHLYDEQRREAAPNLAELIEPKKAS